MAHLILYDHTEYKISNSKTQSFYGLEYGTKRILVLNPKFYSSYLTHGERKRSQKIVGTTQSEPLMTHLLHGVFTHIETPSFSHPSRAKDTCVTEVRYKQQQQ